MNRYTLLTLIAGTLLVVPLYAAPAPGASETKEAATPQIIKAQPLILPNGVSAEADKTQILSRKLLELQRDAAQKKDGAEEALDSFLKKLDSDPDTRKISENYRFQAFSKQSLDKLDKGEFDYGAYKSELKSWIKKGTIPVQNVLRYGLLVANTYAKKNEGTEPDALEKFVNEISDYISSAESGVKDDTKQVVLRQLSGALKTVLGADLKLYGKTLDGQDFDWNSLRGKYVVVKFTATWCGPCKGEIPGLISAYKKYHDKGLEIVSVYVWERGDDNDANNTKIKEFSKKEGIDWRIISEPLTIKAGEPKIGESYNISGVPSMFLIDKEGKIIDTRARGEHLQEKLKEIFGGTDSQTAAK